MREFVWSLNSFQFCFLQRNSRNLVAIWFSCTEQLWSHRNFNTNWMLADYFSGRENDLGWEKERESWKLWAMSSKPKSHHWQGIQIFRSPNRSTPLANSLNDFQFSWDICVSFYSPKPVSWLCVALALIHSSHQWVCDIWFRASKLKNYTFFFFLLSPPLNIHIEIWLRMTVILFTRFNFGRSFDIQTIFFLGY